MPHLIINITKFGNGLRHKSSCGGTTMKGLEVNLPSMPKWGMHLITSLLVIPRLWRLGKTVEYGYVLDGLEVFFLLLLFLNLRTKQGTVNDSVVMRLISLSFYLVLIFAFGQEFTLNWVSWQMQGFGLTFRFFALMLPFTSMGLGLWIIHQKGFDRDGRYLAMLFWYIGFYFFCLELGHGEPFFACIWVYLLHKYARLGYIHQAGWSDAAEETTQEMRREFNSRWSRIPKGPRGAFVISVFAVAGCYQGGRDWVHLLNVQKDTNLKEVQIEQILRETEGIKERIAREDRESQERITAIQVQTAETQARIQRENALTEKANTETELAKAKLAALRHSSPNVKLFNSHTQKFIFPKFVRPTNLKDGE